MTIDQGCSFYLRNKKGENPLHLAATCGNQSLISYGMQRYIQPSVRDRNGETPLHAAVRAGNIMGVQLLLDQGCHRFVPNKNGLMACELLLDENVTQKLPSAVVTKMKKLLVCSLHLSRSRERPEQLTSHPIASSTYPPSSPQGGSLSLLSTMGEIDAEEMTLVHYAAAQGNLVLLDHLLSLLVCTFFFSFFFFSFFFVIFLFFLSPPFSPPPPPDPHSRLEPQKHRWQHPPPTSLLQKPLPRR